MQVTRKIAAAAAVATVATLGLATVVSANVLDDTQKKAEVGGLADAASVASKGYGHGGGKQWYWVKRDGGLVGVDNNVIGPFQACHNQGSVAGIGAAGNADDVLAIIGWDNNGNSVTAVKTCEQGTKQNNGNKWYRMSNDLVSVSDNSVGPFQACHNDVAVAGIGAAGNIGTIAGILGFDNNANAIDSLKTCEQATSQNNG
ncbi:hypothetical protein GCM10029976_063520 [Kribbella albertanoniae]|uniref:Uncharacterized protein n=1 Tax=Kribbella albertanoniae TaxID=1266829 RepID=A0A4R4PTW1_9ACTN|nr:hypothetical protein [Kribbella albertanoniae]TDC25653.1 hypothetical protein E1261_23770 [Kribbella albertanoniae]